MTARRRVGIWLVGAKGGVASTTIVGLAALRRKLIGPTGLVTELPPFAGLPLAAWDDFVVGGHDIRSASLCDEALRVATEMRAIDRQVIDRCRDELAEIDARIRPGSVYNVGPAITALADASIPRDRSPREAIERLRSDMGEFGRSVGAEHVIVVNVASTEPAGRHTPLPATWPELQRMLDDCRGAEPLPASSLYAIAALDLGYSYINFTPSLGSAPAAIDDLARRRGTRHYGCDGKTGETLMKSVLGPMFARRNLRVLSWVGHNIFGNMDGQILDDPANKQSKVASKNHLVGEILGYQPQTLVSIEYVQSLGDWKTAWDHIHFAGFLGTPMTLQFTWQGCDSVLAAPLVVDLIRLTDLARRRGETGQLRFLASFFKSPLGVDEHAFDVQYRRLEEWIEKAGEGK